MFNQINKIYKPIGSKERAVHRSTERKGATHSDDVKAKVLDAILGGMTQKAASIKYGVSEYVAHVIITNHKNKQGE